MKLYYIFFFLFPIYLFSQNEQRNIIIHFPTQEVVSNIDNKGQLQIGIHILLLKNFDYKASIAYSPLKNILVSSSLYHGPKKKGFALSAGYNKDFNANWQVQNNLGITNGTTSTYYIENDDLRYLRLKNTYANYLSIFNQLSLLYNFKPLSFGFHYKLSLLDFKKFTFIDNGKNISTFFKEQVLAKDPFVLSDIGLSIMIKGKMQTIFIGSNIGMSDLSSTFLFTNQTFYGGVMVHINKDRKTKKGRKKK